MSYNYSCVKKVFLFIACFTCFILLGSHAECYAKSDGSTGTITIQNANIGWDYHLYRILDLEMADTSNADKGISYSIPQKYEKVWQSLSKTYLTSDVKTGTLSNTVKLNNKIYYLDITSSNVQQFSMDFMDEIYKKDILSDNVVTCNSTEFQITDLPLGYYLIVPTSSEYDVTGKDSEKNKLTPLEGMISPLSLTSLSPSAIVNSKGGISSLTKTIEKQSLDIGEETNVTIRWVVPYNSSFNKSVPGDEHLVSNIQTQNDPGDPDPGPDPDPEPEPEPDGPKPGGAASYEFIDYTERQILQMYDIELWVNGKLLIGDFDQYVQFAPIAGVGYGWEYNLKDNSLQFHPGDIVEFKYKAKLDPSPDKNNSHKPKEEIERGNSGNINYFQIVNLDEEAQAKMYTYDINLHVTDKETGENLAGASYVLYKIIDGEKRYYMYSPNEGVLWVDLSDDYYYDLVVNKGYGLATSNDDGKTKFEGIAHGQYYIQEINAPSGYTMLGDPVSVYLPENADKDFTVDIQYSKGHLLPDTGGSGTWLLTITGLSIMVGTTILLIRFRKKEKV